MGFRAVGVCMVYVIVKLYWVGASYDLGNNALTQVPDDIPADAAGVLLGNNLLTSVSSGDFEGLPYLELIDLKDNELSVFPHLSSVSQTLKSISLQSNCITTVPAENLDILVKIAYINLNWNQLTSIPDVTGPGDTLLTLYLDSNSFVSFPSVPQLGKSLVALSIEENQLSSLDLKCGYGDDFQIWLGGNPLVCDKHLAWLLSPGISVTRGMCDSPAGLQWRDVTSLSYTDLDLTADNYHGAPAMLIGEDMYCHSLPISKVTMRSDVGCDPQTACEALCRTTPGCMFYNYWPTSATNHSTLCHYAEPLDGRHLTDPPGQAQGWNSYLVP